MTYSPQGVWSYRSFVNDPDLSAEFNSLRFGAGTLDMVVSEAGQISGTLGGPGWSLTLAGEAVDGDPKKVRFQGRGQIGGETWVYDYLGYMVPAWPGGVDQVDAIVGSVIRTEAHSGGQAQAGFVASFYAVRQ